MATRFIVALIPAVILGVANSFLCYLVVAARTKYSTAGRARRMVKVMMWFGYMACVYGIAKGLIMISTLSESISPGSWIVPLASVISVEVVLLVRLVKCDPRRDSNGRGAGARGDAE